MTKQIEIAEGAKVVVTNKDGTTTKALFVSAKAGWTNVTVKGEPLKVRSNAVALDISKADLKKAEAAARKAEKDAAKAAKAESGEDGDDERLVPADLTHYVLHETTTASGRKHIDVDDEVAAKLRTMTLPEMYKHAAEVLDETAKSLIAQYQHLNNGMQRMNLGNRIRKAMRVAAEVQAEVKVEKKAPAAKKAPAEKKARPQAVISDAGAAVAA